MSFLSGPFCNMSLWSIIRQHFPLNQELIGSSLCACGPGHAGDRVWERDHSAGVLPRRDPEECSAVGGGHKPRPAQPGPHQRPGDPPEAHHERRALICTTNALFTTLFPLTSGPTTSPAPPPFSSCHVHLFEADAPSQVSRLYSGWCHFFFFFFFCFGFPVIYYSSNPSC